MSSREINREYVVAFGRSAALCEWTDFVSLEPQDFLIALRLYRSRDDTATHAELASGLELSAAESVKILESLAGQLQPDNRKPDAHASTSRAFA